jgi:hypothetical protein
MIIDTEMIAHKLCQIPLVYPSSLSSDSESLLHLKALLQYRMPLHRRGFYLWMVIAPLTVPFVIVRMSPPTPRALPRPNIPLASHYTKHPIFLLCLAVLVPLQRF